MTLAKIPFSIVHNVHTCKNRKNFMSSVSQSSPDYHGAPCPISCKSCLISEIRGFCSRFSCRQPFAAYHMDGRKPDGQMDFTAEGRGGKARQAPQFPDSLQPTLPSFPFHFASSDRLFLDFPPSLYGTLPVLHSPPSSQGNECPYKSHHGLE